MCASHSWGLRRSIGSLSRTVFTSSAFPCNIQCPRKPFPGGYQWSGRCVHIACAIRQCVGRERSLLYIPISRGYGRDHAAGGIDLNIKAIRPIGGATTMAERMLSFYWKKTDTPRYTNSLVCNICGSNQFSEGPFGRRSRTGKLPACVSCGSLERHRLIRHVWACIPVEDLHWKRALQFSMDPSVEGSGFVPLKDQFMAVQIL